MFDPGHRLSAAACLAYGGEGFVDIGTDHAYLPAFLVLNGKCPRALACDIGMGPLQNAAATLERFGLKDKIELRISDGLKNVSPNEAKEIAICGMGGTLIARILSDALWIKKNGMRLILQPMTHAEDVRRYLNENGFSVDREIIVSEGKRLYCCVSAHYDAVVRAQSPGFYFFGTQSTDDPAAMRYLKKQAKRLSDRAAALELAGQQPEEAAILREALSFYRDVYGGDGNDCT